MAESSSSRIEALAATRKGSLVRGIGIIGSVALGVSAIGLFSSGIIPTSTIASNWPGVSLTGIISIALVIAFFHSYTYAVIGAMAPKSGADYIISTRTLSAPLGFGASVTLVVFASLTAGSFLSSISQTVIPAFIKTTALITSNDALLELAVQIAAPQLNILIGTVLLMVIFSSFLLSQKSFMRIILAGALLSIAAWVVLLLQLGTAPAGSFTSAWDRFMGPGNYGNIPLLAEQQGMVSNTDPAMLIIPGLLLSFWLFFGSFAPTFVAGEIKQPGRNVIAGNFISLLVVGIIFIISTLLLQQLIPSQWLSAQAYLSQISGQTSNNLPYITFYAAILQPTLPGVIFIAAGWLVSLVIMIQTFLAFCGRIILAWARDRMVPSVFYYLHPRTGTPIVAILMSAILVELGLVNGAQGLMATQINLVFSMLVCTAFPILSAAAFPFLRKAWYAKSSPVVRLSIARIPVITIAGFIVLAYMAWLIFTSIFTTSGINGVSPTNLIALVVVYFMAVGWFFVRKLNLRRRGIDVNAIYKNMPED